MKLLYIAGDISRIGGIEKYNRDFINALKLAKADLTVLQRYKGGFFAKASFALRFLQKIIFNKYDHIICSHLNFAPLCLMAKKFIRTPPYTISLYGIEVLDVKSKYKARAICESDQIITISNYTKSYIIKQFPDAESKIFMLKSSVDGNKYYIKEKSKELLEKHKLNGRPIILTIARLSTSEYKGQDRVLKSLPRVLESVPDAIYLIVGGGEDSRVNEFLKYNPHLMDNVIFTGPVSDEAKVDYYNLGDLYILPSMYEGFGIVFIESLACGVPVIASDAYGCREGLLNGELGLLVQPEDTEEIASAIIKVLRKEASAQLYNREFLRKRNLEIYSIETWNKNVKNFLSKLKKPLAE